MTDTIRAAGILGHPGADAVRVDGGKVVWVGSSEAVEPTHHFPDGFLIPGLRDAHIHPVAYAAALAGAGLAAATSIAEVVEITATRAAGLQPGAAVLASGLDDERLAEGRLPTRADLDGIDRPVILVRRCGHVAIANTPALLGAGITPATADPPGGSIDRDPAGEPTGILRETAVVLVTDAFADDLPAPSGQEILTAMAVLADRGITSLDAMVSAGGPGWCGSPGELDDLLAVAPQFPLGVGIFVMAQTAEELAAAAARIDNAGGPVRWRGWKGFADGSLGGHTAALDAPYLDRPATRGTVRLDDQRDPHLARMALRLGGDVAIHAIGDRGNRLAIELFADLTGEPGGRLRVEHASLLPGDLLGRLASLGVVASVQPSFPHSDRPWLGTRLGENRARAAYPFRAIQDAGITLLGGSDAPVEDPDPWTAIAAARAHALSAEQSLTAEGALRLYLSHDMAIGCPADLVVVDRDPLHTSDVASTGVSAVFVAGRRIDRSPPAGSPTAAG